MNEINFSCCRSFGYEKDNNGINVTHWISNLEEKDKQLSILSMQKIKK